MNQESKLLVKMNYKACCIKGLEIPTIQQTLTRYKLIKIDQTIIRIFVVTIAIYTIAKSW